MEATYFVRFAQKHETFQKPELDALALLHDIELQWLQWKPDVRPACDLGEDQSPYAIIKINPATSEAAARLISRSILASSIHELWGKGNNFEQLHEDVKQRTSGAWPLYKQSSFRFDLDGFQGSRLAAAKKQIIENFSFMPFEGPIIMRKPDQVFTVFEEYEQHASEPWMIYFGRFIAESSRKIVAKYDLKKRNYIATTSMDAELSLLTANIAMAAPGKLAYDPFMGTGSFPVSCAAFGAVTFGSDLDGRSVRGKKSRSVASNFKQYDTNSRYLGGFAADLTNTPLTVRPLLDVVICDPPYGVREGLKVLGHVKERLQSEVTLADGTLAHLRDDYIPPKKPYSFDRMLGDILDFSADMLVPGGRLCMWMPVAVSSDDESESAKSTAEQYAIPKHPCLKLEDVCQQDFTKWSRRLLAYSRLPDSAVNDTEMQQYQQTRQQLADFSTGATDADSLNQFRKHYFASVKD